MSDLSNRVNALLEGMGADPLTPAEADAVDAVARSEASGLPQSRLGGLHPELRARITAARTATDAFDRETDAYIDGIGDRPLFEDHAWRLHSELKLLLSKIEDVK